MTFPSLIALVTEELLTVIFVMATPVTPESGNQSNGLVTVKFSPWTLVA